MNVADMLALFAESGVEHNNQYLKTFPLHTSVVDFFSTIGIRRQNYIIIFESVLEEIFDADVYRLFRNAVSTEYNTYVQNRNLYSREIYNLEHTRDEASGYDELFRSFTVIFGGLVEYYWEVQLIKWLEPVKTDTDFNGSSNGTTNLPYD